MKKNSGYLPKNNIKIQETFPIKLYTSYIGGRQVKRGKLREFKDGDNMSKYVPAMGAFIEGTGKVICIKYEVDNEGACYVEVPIDFIDDLVLKWEEKQREEEDV